MIERYFKHVYCENQFLEQAVSKIKDKKFSFEDNDEMQIWICIMSLIFSPNISLFLDIKKEQFIRIIDEIEERINKAAENDEEIKLSNYDNLMRDLHAAQQDGKLSLECIGVDLLSNFESFEEKWKMNGYYLTCKDKSICNTLMADYGILAICPNNIQNFKSIIYDDGVAIKKRDKGCWEKILHGFLFPCNSLTIVDNYVLNDTYKMEENLSQVFRALLPEKLNEDSVFHITIITSLRDFKKKQDLPSKIRKEKLDNLMKEIRPKLKYTITIFKCSSDLFHDRSIITNNILICCGAGFELFNKQTAQKSTTINIVCPYITNTVKWANQAYTNLVTEIRALYKDIPEFSDSKKSIINDSFPSFYLGEKENRLFEME